MPCCNGVRMSKRHTKQGKATNERERAILARVVRALHRHGFKTQRLTELDRDGVRISGLDLYVYVGRYAAKPAYSLYMTIALPGRTPDRRQREAVVANPRVVVVRSPSEALRLVSVGILGTAQ